MTKNLLFSLSYPGNPTAQKVYEHRVVRFFDYSVSNTMSLILGTAIISLVLVNHEANIYSVFTYFLVTSSIAIASYFTCQRAQKKGLDRSSLPQFIKLRILLGCAIGAMYAFAVYMLPESHINEGILFLTCIYTVSISIAIFQYSVIPTYYILFSISIYLPLTYLIITTPNDVTLLTLLLIVLTLYLFISKGLKVSKNEINLIEVNLNLQTEATKHRATRKKLQEMAMFDNLTKVANRYYFEEQARAVISQASDANQQLALLFIDLNNFKPINDNYGHEIGDKVLIAVANKIKKHIRPSDLVARLGGDEFVVVLSNYNLNEVKKKHIDPMRSELNENILVGEFEIKLRASIGISIFPYDGINLKQLLLCADSKMYKQKQKDKSDTDLGF